MVQAAGSPLRHADCIFAGGRWIQASSAARIAVVTPSTEEVYFHVADAQPADVDRAVAAAREAFDNGPWPRMSPAERAGYMRAIAAEIIKRKPDLEHIWTGETGMIATRVKEMVGGAADLFNYYAAMADTYPFEERHTPIAGGTGLLVREPVGVVAAILPWNGPVVMTAVKLAPALLAGCTVVLKAAPEAPGGVYLMAEVMEAAGLPPGVFNMIAADRAASEHLVRHPGVDKVTFTGSSAAGKKVASICGERIARVTLELGGKSPAIVLDDYDVEKAAQAISETAPLNTGQVCYSITRVIVSRQRHDDLVEAMADRFSKILVGDPYDPAIQMGPLAMSRQRDRVEGYIAKGKAEGAMLAFGGARPSHLNRGFYIEPTIFANVDNAMTIAREEIFGPVVSVIPVDDEEHAIRIANDTDFGLNASVFSNDAGRVYDIARRLRSGTVGHNYCKIDISMAFGGFKQSGLGREGGTEGLTPFLETKTILLDAPPPHLAS